MIWNISEHDIGTEELAHMEMICAIVHQLTRNLTPDEIVASGFDKYYVDHTLALWPQSAGGFPFNSCEFQSKGDAITDLMEDMAAEQKARTTYDNILRLVKDPEVCDPIRFLRQREIVHFQRFGDAKRTDLRRQDECHARHTKKKHCESCTVLFDKIQFSNSILYIRFYYNRLFTYGSLDRSVIA